MTASADPIRFLLVDDLPENLLALEALLKREGLVCDTARTGEDALELMLRHEYALALLDVQMPGMDGFELAEFMRANERSRHIPIIFVTAGTGDASRRFRGYEAGAVDFIQKPIEADVLRSKASVFLDLYEQRRRVAAQRDELARLGGRLQAADQQKNRFLAVLGHELRNPIMSLYAGLRLFDRGSDKFGVDELRSHMQRSLDHMSRLIDDLLDIARIEQGKISLGKERVDLAERVSFALEILRPGIEQAGHVVTVEGPAEPIMLDADPARLKQIISNLVGNAVKYTPEPGEIRIATGTEGRWAVITVADSGIGIPAAEQERIFQIFEQVENGTGVVGDGLGIGLALVKQLVELHDGQVRLVSSTPGEGSTFEARLPLSTAG